jgi:uncharacterized protein YjbI with pentapeptide repeats
MEGANLCGANLSMSNGKKAAAKLTGANMKNVNLAFASLISVNMQSVSFHNQNATGCAPSDCRATSPSSCSTVYKANLTDVNLSRSYIAGLDLSNSLLHGTDFSGIFGQGANFSGTEIMPNNGKAPNFTNSVLIGANFGSAKVQNALFDNAYFGDPAKTSSTSLPKATVTLLSQAYTAGNPDYADRNVCPIFFIPTTEVAYPNTDVTVTCPDGTQGPCTGSKWMGSVKLWPDTVALSYSQQISTPTGCATYDPSW